MKKINKKLQELSIAHDTGKLTNFIETLAHEKQIGNYLNYIETKKRALISESFNKIILIEREIEKIKSSLEEKIKMNGSYNLQLSWLNDDIVEIKNKRDFQLKYWGKIEDELKEKQKEHKMQRVKRVQENNI